jgi:molybdate transport system substrate-binding protein
MSERHADGAAGGPRGIRSSEPARSGRAGRAHHARCAIAAYLLLVLGAAAGRAELIVGAAASLREPIEALAKLAAERRPALDVRVSFGASSALAAQVRLGAPLDVFLSADGLLIDLLADEGLVAPANRFPLARNRLVILRRPGLAATLDGAGDLATASIRRIAVASSAAPVGRYARAWLESRGQLSAVEVKLVSTEHARAALSAVEHGHVDVAIVYATDARVAKRAQIAFVIPPDQQPDILYWAAGIGARSGSATVSQDQRAFLDLVQSGAMRQLLDDAGFLPVLPASDSEPE